MKRKGAHVVAGIIVVCLLTGMLGVYSASGFTRMGLTYRLNDWGGVKCSTQSGFGGELLLNYRDYTYEDASDTYFGFPPSLLYHFKKSSGTSPYVGIGYLSYANSWTGGSLRESGFRLLAGKEYFFSEKFSLDLRATAAFNTWNETWGSSEEQVAYTAIYIDMGVSIYR